MTVTKFPESEITTNSRVEAHLRASLRAAGVSVPLWPTWGQLRDAIDLLLKDTDPINSLEYGVRVNDRPVRLTVERDLHGAWNVRER